MRCKIQEGSAVGGGQPTTTKMAHVSAENAADNVVPQLPNVTNKVSEEAAVPDPGREEEAEGGGEGGAAKENSGRLTRPPDLVDQMKRIKEEMKIHRQILRGSMALISESICPIYNEDHGHHHFYEVEEADSFIEKCRNDYGLPDVTSERKVDEGSL